MSAMPSPTSSVTFPQTNLDDTLGALLIGGFINAVLTGVTSTQIYAYYGQCQRDARAMRWALSLLWALDVVCLALTMHTVYHYTVTNFMNPAELRHIPWSLAADMIIGPLSQVIVVSVYACRIWKLSGKAWTLLLILPLAFCDFGGAIAITVLLGESPFYTDFAAKASWLWSATFAAWALVDCIIAATMCTILIRQRTGFRKTDSLIKTLVVYSSSTGALTSSVAIASVLTHTMMPDSFICTALALNLPKFMLNSLLSLLNSRESMRDKISGTVSVHLSKLPTVPEPLSYATKRRDLDWVIQTGEEPSKFDEGMGLDSDGQYGHV